MDHLAINPELLATMRQEAIPLREFVAATGQGLGHQAPAEDARYTPPDNHKGPHRY